MVPTERNKEIVREFYVRFGAGDVAGAVDLLADDVTWWQAGDHADLPAAGTYTKDGITDLFARMARRLNGNLAMTVTGVIAEGERVAVEFSSHGELANGRIYRNQYHAAIRVVGDRIREVREYNDTLHTYRTWYQR